MVLLATRVDTVFERLHAFYKRLSFIQSIATLLFTLSAECLLSRVFYLDNFSICRGTERASLNDFVLHVINM